MSDTGVVRLLLFRVGGLVCAAEADRVREIVPWFEPTRIPGAPPVVAGVVNVLVTLGTVVDGRRATVRDILARAGFEVVGEAETGSEAVEKYRQLKPDLVTMDIVMPDMGGIDAVREIVKHDPDAKILMCSAMGQQALVVEAIQAGAKDFVVKPFQPSRVLEAVQRVLG